MGFVKDNLCGLAISLIHGWLVIERIIIRLFLKSAITAKVRDFYRLDAENAGLISVNNPEFYIHTANKSLLGFCESYMNGWISITKVDEAVANIMRSGKVREDPGFKYKAFLDYLEFELFHVSSPETSIKMAEAHYNMGNDLFEAMLGKDMNYSCGLWLHPNDTLESAQRNKMDLLAKKMKLKPGMR